MSSNERFPSALWPSYAGPSWRSDLPVIARADGRYLIDEEGRRYLDFTSGLWNACYGLDRPDLVAALEHQAATLAFCRHDGLRHRPAERLADRLRLLSPVCDARVFFGNSGSEANEAAVHFALRSHRAGGGTGGAARFKVATIEGAFHGVTSRCLAIAGRPSFRRAMGPFVDGCFLLPFPSDGVSTAACLREAERTVAEQDPEALALIFVEPILGGGGIRIPPDEYLHGLQDLAHRAGALFGVDEVATGMGRTGAFFRSATVGLDPDFVTIGKALGGGFFPISAVLVRGALFDRIVLESGESVLVGHTTSAHPLGCAVALANIETMEARGFARQARDIEALLHEALAPLARSPLVAEVRGVGTMFGVELVRSVVVRGAARTVPLPSYVIDGARHRGLLVESLEGNAVVGLLPPLNTTADEVAFAVGILRDLLAEAETRVDDTNADTR